MESHSEHKFERIIGFFTAFFQRMWELFQIGLCFMAFSLPVLTVFSSFAAMMHCVWQIDTQKGSSIFRMFWEAFRAEALRTGLIGFFCTLICSASIVSGTYYYFLTEGSAIHYLSIAFFALLFLYSASFFLCFVCANARISLPFTAMIKNAAQYVFLSLPNNLGLLIALCLLGILFFIKPVLLILFPLAASGFCWLTIVTHRGKIEKYMLDDT